MPEWVKKLWYGTDEYQPPPPEPPPTIGDFLIGVLTDVLVWGLIIFVVVVAVRITVRVFSYYGSPYAFLRATREARKRGEELNLFDAIALPLFSIFEDDIEEEGKKSLERKAEIEELQTRIAQQERMRPKPERDPGEEDQKIFEKRRNLRIQKHEQENQIKADVKVGKMSLADGDDQLREIKEKFQQQLDDLEE